MGALTVGKLVEILKTIPQDMKIVVSDAEHGDFLLFDDYSPTVNIVNDDVHPQLPYGVMVPNEKLEELNSLYEGKEKVLVL